MSVCISTERHEHGMVGRVLNMLLLMLFFFLVVPATGSTGHDTDLTLSITQSNTAFPVSSQVQSSHVFRQGTSVLFPVDTGTMPVLFLCRQVAENAIMDVSEDWSFPVSALTGNRTVFSSENIQETTAPFTKNLRTTKLGEKRSHAFSNTFLHSDGIVLPQRSVQPFVKLQATPRCLLPSARGLVVFSLPPPHSC